MNITNKMINLTLDDLQSTMPYVPDKPCFDWCLMQQVVHSNNMELYAVMFVVFAYFSILAYYFAGEVEVLKPYKEMFIYWAKLLLILFFAFYILVIRLRLIW